VQYDSCIVSATVIDQESGISSATFYLSYFHYFNALPTTNLADSFFAIIPGMSEGYTIRYFIEAIDNSNNIALSDTMHYYIPVFKIYIAPEIDTLNIDSTIVFTLQLQGAKDIFAISVDVTYDTTIIDLDTVTLAEPNLLGSEDLIFLYQNTPDGLSVGIGRIQTDGNDNISGSGPLFDMTFEGIYEGSSLIEPQNIMIRDEDGLENIYLDSIRIESSVIYVQ